MAKLIIYVGPSGSGSFNNIEKCSRVETCSADEGTIDIGFSHKVGGILWLDAPTINDANGGTWITEHFYEEFADLLMNLIRLGGGGNFTGSDGPDRFIGDNKFFNLIHWKTGKGGVDLSIDDGGGFSCLSLS